MGPNWVLLSPTSFLCLTQNLRTITPTLFGLSSGPVLLLFYQWRKAEVPRVKSRNKLCMNNKCCILTLFDTVILLIPVCHWYCDKYCIMDYNCNDTVSIWYCYIPSENCFKKPHSYQGSKDFHKKIKIQFPHFSVIEWAEHVLLCHKKQSSSSIIWSTYPFQGHSGAGADPSWHWVTSGHTLDESPVPYRAHI